MHRAPLGDLGELHALLVRERPGDLERSLDLIEPRRSILAMLVVLGVRARVMQANDDALERPFLRSAYMRSVIAVHAPSAASTRS